MKIKYVVFILSIIFLLDLPYAFAFSEFEKEVSKERAISLALKEEAIREAFEEVEIENSDNLKVSKANFDFLSRLHPYFYSNLVYTDNVYLIPTNIAKSDLYFDITPGVKIIFGDENKLETNKINQLLELDLGAEIVSSMYRSAELNSESPYVNLFYELRGKNNLLSFEQNFADKSDLKSNYTLEASGLAYYQYNATSLSVEHKFNRFGIGLGYKRAAYNYYKDYKASSTYEDHLGILTGFYEVSPKTRLFAEYDHGKVDYFKASSSLNNAIYDVAWLGIQGEVTKKINGLAKFGYEIKDFKYGSTKEMPAVKVNLTYRKSPKLTFLLEAFKGSLDSTYVGDYGADDCYSAYLGFIYNLNSKLAIGTRAKYQNDSFESGRVDKTYDGSLKLGFLFSEHIKFGLNYDYKYRSSSNSEAEYKANVYTLNADITF